MSEEFLLVLQRMHHHSVILVFRYTRTNLMCVVFFGFMSTCISSIVRVAIDFLSIWLSEFLTYMIDPPPLLDGVGLSTLSPYQSEDPSPTLPTYRGKEEKRKLVEDKKGESN